MSERSGGYKILVNGDGLTSDEKKISEYIVVSSDDVNSFTRYVNRRMKEGFTPWGSPFIDSVNLVQAMVKYT